MTDIALLAIDVTSAPAVKGAADLDKLTLAAGKADVATDKLAASSTRMATPLLNVGKSAVITNRNIRSLSVQLSQVAQQGAASGNFLQAFSLQLADIGLAFGPVGIAAGALATVALPAVINAFSGTSDAAQKAKATLDGLDDAVKAYADAAAAASAPTADLIAKYGELSTVAQQALQALSDVRQVEAINAVDAAVQQLTGTLLGLQSVGGSRSARAAQLGLADDFGLAADEANRLESALLALNNARGLEAQARAANDVRAALFAAYGSVEAMPKPLRDAVAQLGVIVPRAAEVDTKTKATKASQDALNASLAGAYGLYANLVGQASALADETARAAMAAASLNYGKIQNSGQSGPDAAKSSVQALNANAPGVLSSGAGGVRRTPGGGSSGGTDDFASRLESLRGELATERQVVDDWYAEAQTILADRRTRELLTAQEHNDLKLSIESEYLARVRELQDQANQEEISARQAVFSEAESLLGVFAGKSKAAAVAAILLNKGLRIGEIIQNTAAAQVRALAELGPIAGPPAAAKIGLYGKLQAGLVAATGLAQAAGSGNGGGIGGLGRGAAQGSTATNANTTSAPARPVEISVRLDSSAFYQGQQFRDLMDAAQKDLKDRGVVFKFV